LKSWKTAIISYFFVTQNLKIMRTLLVATDFSLAATNAAKYAAELALAIQADIELFYVFQVPVSYAEIPVAVNIDEFVTDAEAEMHKLKKELAVITDHKVNLNSRVVTGVFFQELESVCEQIDPYAVVMGSQGTTAAERVLFGGHTVYAMRHLQWPMITVPPGAKFSSVKKVALACDLEHVGETIPTKQIEALVNDLHAELMILNTGKRREFNPDSIYESGVLRRKFAGLNPDYHFIASEDEDKGIIDFVDDHHIDLLVVVPKHPGLLQTITHRSHTKQLILHCHVPVMAIHY